MKRGDIFTPDLNPSRGSEQSGVRPVILIQRNNIERFTRTYLVVPLTSNLRRSEIPGTFVIPEGEGGLTQDSVALCYQTVVLDHTRLIRQIGELSPPYIEKLRKALIYTLNLEDSSESLA